MIGSFIEVGFRHIVSIDALDHLLFLGALAASYRLADWRHGLLVLSAFTIGHSLTLALVALNVVQPPVALVEFLIPCTIVVAALENVWSRSGSPTGWHRPVLTGLFGLVHGAGFASTLRGLFDGGLAMPLLGFNIGIEAGQILVLGAFVLTLSLVDRLLTLVTAPATRWRLVTTSAVVGGLGLMLAVERIPW